MDHGIINHAHKLYSVMWIVQAPYEVSAYDSGHYRNSYIVIPKFFVMDFWCFLQSTVTILKLFFLFLFLIMIIIVQ